MRSPHRKPGFRHWKRVLGIVQRVHRTPTEWREIMARFRASGQSKSKFCEQNAIARSTFILWERRLASGDDGSTPACAAEWFVEVEDDGDEAPAPRGSGLFAEVTDAGALVTDPDSRSGLEDGRGWRSCARASPARANGSWRSAWRRRVHSSPPRLPAFRTRSARATPAGPVRRTGRQGSRRRARTQSSPLSESETVPAARSRT